MTSATETLHEPKAHPEYCVILNTRLRSARTMNEQRAELQRFQRDIDYFESHQQELLRQHPEQWVAILDERVVGTSADADELLERLDQQGVPLEKALVKHLTTQEEVFILYR
jgi:hypothetical protein